MIWECIYIIKDIFMPIHRLNIKIKLPLLNIGPANDRTEILSKNGNISGIQIRAHLSPL
jgi:hypothetical protein